MRGHAKNSANGYNTCATHARDNDADEVDSDERQADDDMGDALRYALAKTPFVVLLESDIKEAEKEIEREEKPKEKICERMAYYLGHDMKSPDSDEEYLNECYELFEVY